MNEIKKRQSDITKQNFDYEKQSKKLDESNLKQ